jgi:hypothetical protein
MTYTNGPVPLDAPDYYVPRTFESETLHHILKRDWVLLLGPRQHGKTSALLRIRNHLREAGLRCAFVDLQALPPGLTFPALLEWVTRRIAMSLNVPFVVAPEGRVDSFEDWLNSTIPMPGAPVVILIDEASAIRDELVRNSFYGQIRALKSAGMAAEPGAVSSIVQFVFSGTFRPEALVDELNSPFNVCLRVDTEDFTLANISGLSSIALRRPDVGNIPQLIFDAVGGQPHLVQHLLSVVVGLEGVGEEDAIAAEVERIVENGSDHLDSLLGAVMADKSLTGIAAVAAAQGQVLNDPANVDYRLIQVIGLLRRDGRNLVFRNALYKQIAEASPQLRPEQVQAQGIASHFYPLPGSSFGFIVDLEYREICQSAYNGAVAAFNARSYRLALVAFGVALEAMLVDFLTRQAPGVVATAIGQLHGRARPNFSAPHEVQTDPTTWHLVNQMKVARALHGANGPVEIPEALREMRNFVHPAKIKVSYLPESALHPEAIAAGGLVGIVMRDIV